MGGGLGGYPMAYNCSKNYVSGPGKWLPVKIIRARSLPSDAWKTWACLPNFNATVTWVLAQSTISIEMSELFSNWPGRRSLAAPYLIVSQYGPRASSLITAGSLGSPRRSSEGWRRGELNPCFDKTASAQPSHLGK